MGISLSLGVRDQSSERIKWFKFQSNKDEEAKQKKRGLKTGQDSDCWFLDHLCVGWNSMRPRKRMTIKQ